MTSGGKYMEVHGQSRADRAEDLHSGAEDHQTRAGRTLDHGRDWDLGRAETDSSKPDTIAGLAQAVTGQCESSQRAALAMTGIEFTDGRLNRDRKRVHRRPP